MRKSTSLIGALFGAGLLMSAAAALAAEPTSPAAPQGVCRTADGAITKCAPVKAGAVQPRVMQVARTTLDRNTCNRQPTKIERDTCLNRVESTA